MGRRQMRIVVVGLIAAFVILLQLAAFLVPLALACWVIKWFFGL